MAHFFDLYSPETWVALATVALAIITAWLAYFTRGLWRATVDLSRDARRVSDRQAREMVQSLAIAETAANAAKQNAEAAVRSEMPILYPLIVTPLPTAYSVGASPALSLAFENFGKTPGIICEVRAELILGERSDLPETVAFSTLERADLQQVLVPGNSWMDAATKPTVGAAYKGKLTQGDVTGLHAEATEEHYKRFHLVGRVTYDDFFGIRYAQTFCLKVRGTWRSPKGGGRLNKRTATPIPDTDPYE